LCTQHAACACDPNTDNLQCLIDRLPTLDPEIVKTVVESILKFPLQHTLGKRKSETSLEAVVSTENRLAILDNPEANSSDAKMTTPLKGSNES
jgi:hypothetical protein